jgi:hygromycin-B 7''-O-kinase
MLLPQALTLESYSQQLRQGEVWAPALKALAAQYAPGHPPELIPFGSALVCRLGPEQVLKLLPPFWQQEAVTEAAALATAQDRLSVAIPTLYATGELEGWPYLLMETLPGTPLDRVWPRLDGTNRRFLLQQVGELIQELQSLPIPPAFTPWHTRLPLRQQELPQRLADHHIPEVLQPTLLTHLAEHFPKLASTMPHCFLQGDLTGEHLLVYQQNGRWELCGLFDFGEAFAGPACYEMIAPLLHLGLSAQERSWLWECAQIDPPQPLLPWILSHPHWSVSLHQAIVSAQESATPLTSLESHLS